MTERLTRVRLGELADRGVLTFSDGYRTKRAELGPGVPILRVREVGDGRVVPSAGDQVRSEFRAKMGAKVSEAGDVLITTKGTVGRVAHVPNEFPPHVYSPQVCYIRVVDASAIDPTWLYCWVRSPAFHQQLERAAHQTDMAPYLNLRDLREFSIALPSLEVQRGIAGVLGALDDLIDTNERLVTTIRELSATLFEAWIDHGEETRALSDVAEINPLAVKPGEGSLSYLDISSVGDGSLTWPADISWADAPTRARRSVAHGDVIWSSVRPNRRSHSLVLSPPKNAVASTGFVVLRPRPEADVASAYLFAATDRQQFTEHLVAHASGSAYPATRPEDFASARLPSLGERGQAFEDVLWPAWELVGELQHQNGSLRRTRDELLPLLMSGRVLPGEVA